MNPRKPKTAVKKTAESTAQTEQLVSDLTHFYWGKVRKSLSSLEHQRVAVANFGTFMVRMNKMEKRINKYEEILGRLDVSKYTGMAKYTILNDRVVKMKDLIERLQQEWKDRSEHYDKKNANREGQADLE